MATPGPVAIVGAGVAGLSSAAFLARVGVEVILFERFEAARPVGSGLLLQPTGLAVLDRLGLLEEAIALGSRIERLEGRTSPQDRTIFNLRYDALRPGLFGLGMHRASLFHLLLKAATAAGVSIRPGAAMVNCDEDASGARLTDVDGGRHGPFALVIDASGARSRLRERTGATAPRPFPFAAVWGVARHTVFERTALQQRYRRANIMVGVLPMGRLPDDPTPLDAFFWSVEASSLDRLAQGDIDAFRRSVCEIWPETADLVVQFPAIASLSQARYAQATAPRVNADSLVLVGDAAHQTSPQLGQGANMALLDAAALADAVARHGPTKAALLDYGDRRRAHVRFYQTASAALTPFFQSNSRAAALLRDMTFAPMARVPWLRREMIRTLTGVKTGLFSAGTPYQLAGETGPEKPVVASSRDWD